MASYSSIKKSLQIDVSRESDNELAYLTHYFQNSVNGVSKHYKMQALNYIKLARKELNLAKDIPIQLYLPKFFDVPFPPPAEYEYTFIDLFAGIGGFRIPLQKLNGKCVFSCENNIHAQRVYESNFGEIPFGDITKLEMSSIPPHDILTAGFPCQPFSISGKLKGFEDTRGTLIYNVFKIIEEKKPKVVLLENVKHLLHHDNGNTLETIMKHLYHLGYNPRCEVLNASDFGVPQNRERVIIVGHQSKVFDFSKIKTKPRTILKNILDKEGPFEYLNESVTILDDTRPQKSGLIFIGYRNKSIRKAGVRPGTENLSRVHKQPNRIYSVEGLHPALPSQESSGRFWIYENGIVRKLTINECYKLMGFPTKFKKSKNTSESYRQIGNSVCVPMIKEVMKQIKQQLLQ